MAILHPVYGCGYCTVQWNIFFTTIYCVLCPIPQIASYCLKLYCVCRLKLINMKSHKVLRGQHACLQSHLQSALNEADIS